MQIKFVNILAAIVAVFVVAACGGSGGGTSEGGAGVSTSPVQPVIAAQTDVSFINVPTSVTKDQVIQGQDNVEVAALRMDWKNQSRPTISQMVFTNDSTASLWTTFKDFKLVDNNGNDIMSEARYNILYDDAKHEVTVNFYQAPWYPNDFGVVPKTYSLLASLDPAVPVGTTGMFKLTAVQLHEADKTASFDVSGVQFEVVKIAGMSLPTITTSSPVSLIAATSDISVNRITVGNFTASCPTDSYSTCYLESLTYSAGGMSEPILSVDGWVFFSDRSSDPNDPYTFNAPIGYSLNPGQSKTFTVFATPYQANPFISIPDMVWVVWGTVRVNPIIPSGPASCGLMVSDGNGCKG